MGFRQLIWVFTVKWRRSASCAFSGQTRAKIPKQEKAAALRPIRREKLQMGKHPGYPNTQRAFPVFLMGGTAT